MKRIICSLLVFVVAIFFAGCGASTPKLPVTGQLQFNGIENFSLRQTHRNPKLYGSSEELESIFNEEITKFLTEKDILSTDDNSDTLKIDVVYFKKFIREGTLNPSDALDFPDCEYKIQILDKNGNVLRSTKQYATSFSNNFKNNFTLKTLQRDIYGFAGMEYQITFIKQLSYEIITNIVKLKETK